MGACLHQDRALEPPCVRFMTSELYLCRHQVVHTSSKVYISTSTGFRSRHADVTEAAPC
jgi:hypothetical protein